MGRRIEICLSASGHEDHSKGREFLTSSQNHQLQLRLGAKSPGYPCWDWLWMESLPSCRRKNLLPAVLQFKGATTSSSAASVPTPGECSGQTGVPGRLSHLSCCRRSTGAGSSSSTAFWVAVRSQMMGPLTGDVLLLRVAVPSQEASTLPFPALSVTDRCEHWKCYTLVSDLAALLVYQLIFHTESEGCSAPGS